MKNLNKIEFVHALIGLFLVAALSSCGKVDDQLNSSVTIKMPDLSNGVSELVSAQMNSSVSTPTQLSDINCYAVMVGGPAGEPTLNRTRCEVVTVATTLSGTETIETKTVVGNRQVGMIRGLVPSNGIISLEVPTGNDRVFSLVGFKASPITSCLGFTDPNINLDLVSNPILLGTTGGVNLTGGGAVNTVNIQMQSVSGSIANNNQIGECYGPDNPGSSKIIPTRAKLTKNSFPKDVLVANSCNAIDVEFVDNLGRNGELPVSAVVSLSYITRDASGTQNSGGNFYDFYNSQAECSSNAPTVPSLPIQAKARSRQVWIKTVSATTVSYQLEPDVFASGTKLFEGDHRIFPSYPSHIPIISFDFFGPRRVLADTCYKMSARIVSTSGTASASSTSYSYQVEHLLAGNFIDTGASFYTGDNNEGNYICNESNKINHGASSTALISDSVINRPYFFVKYSSNSSYRQTSLGLTPLTSGTLSVSAPLLLRGVHPIEVITGNAVPARLFINGPNQIKSNDCANYYQVQIANTLGAAVPASSTIRLTTSFISGGPGSVFIAANHTTSCPNLNTITQNTSFTTGQYSRDFTLKATASMPSVIRVTATATVSGTVNPIVPLQESYFDITVTPP